MYKPLLLLSCALMLTACASGVRPTGASLTMPLPSPQDMTPCETQIPPPASGARADLLANHVETAKALHSCAAKQAALVRHIQAVRQAQTAR